MSYAVLKTLHLLSVIVWVGGMVFAHFFLRPALAQFELPVRVRLMHGVLARFFAAVLVAAVLALATGTWMIGQVAKQTVQAGLAFKMPVEWMLMTALGVLMVLIFGHIRFVLYKRLNAAVMAQDWPAGGRVLVQIRRWVAVNLAIGVVIVVVTMVGLSL